MNQQQLIAQFKTECGYAENIRLFFAPGRVNLIGEHTDYNGGYVFPAALTFGTWAVVSPRQDGIYCFRSANFPGQAVECSVKEGISYKQEDDWANYPKGVLKELLELDGGAKASLYTGADVLFYGNIPNGAGLSSSASIELVTGLALSKLAGIGVEMLELVKIGQRAENRFVGVNCGIMDQFTVGMGKEGHAIKLDCDTLEFEYVPVQIDGYKLVITNTNKRRGLADSKYNERRSECEQGLSIIQQQLPEVHCLGDVSYNEWVNVKSSIENEVIRRRVLHVVTEDDRVLQATKSLQENDLITFGDLMKKSHESLRDLYEVTGTELDTLFEEAAKIDGCIGTRMTGAGFGGCNVSLVKEEAVETFKQQVAENYRAKTGLEPDFYICEIGDGTKEILLEE
ncbi:galactokinase [Bacillota bacterium Lsc_1132]